jgi:general secretion pathway protein G
VLGFALALAEVMDGERGMTLIEIMVVVAIMGLMAGGIAVAAIHAWKVALIKQVRREAQTLKGAATRWRLEHSEGCPTLEDLVRERLVEKIHNDPWGHAYVLGCSSDGETFTVASTGPDGRLGTADDVVP